MKRLFGQNPFMSGERVLALLFLLIMVLYGYGATGLQRSLREDVVGPHTFPLLLSGFGIIIAVLYFFRAFRSKSNDDAIQSDGFRVEISKLVSIALLLVYVFALTSLGFLLSTFLYVIVTLRLLGQPTWASSALYSTVLTGLIFLLFDFLLDASLPVGDIFSS